MATKTKKCARCGKTKPVTDFPRDRKQKDGISTWCKQSWRDYREEKAGGKKIKGAKVTVKKAAKASKPAKISKPTKAVSDRTTMAKPGKEDD